MKTEWKYLEMGEVCDFIGGSQPPKTDFIFEPKEGYVRLIQIRDYKSDKNITYVPKGKARRFCNKNDIMIGRYGPPLFQILRGLDGAYNVALMKAQPKDNSILHQEYLYYFLRNEKLFNYIVSNSERTAGQDGIKRELLENYIIPLPPIAEQKRIAAILDKADAIRRKRQEAIKLTEELGRSLFLDMFGDPVTNPKGWDVVELEKLLVFMTTGSRGWAKYYSTKGQLFLRIQNVKNGRLLLDDVAYVNAPDSAEARRTCVKEGDVLVSMTADLGRTAVIPKGLNKAFVNQHLGILRLKQDQISSVYLSSFLTSEGGQIQFSKLNREGVKAGLNFDDIKSLKILVPPVYIQKKYESLFHFLMNTLGKYKEGLNYNENLFNSLLQRAFKGEL